jgi:hypothetical protein
VKARREFAKLQAATVRRERDLEALASAHGLSADVVDTRDLTVDRRTCGCGRPFSLAAGEVRAATALGLPLPTQCRPCRPTRRESIALQSARRPPGGAALVSPQGTALAGGDGADSH